MTNNYMPIFLDLMDYLNTNAKKMGANNIKDLCRQAIEKRYYKDDESTKRFIHFCNLRNDIAHGKAYLSLQITEEVVYDMYFIGICLLFLFSEEWKVEQCGNDFYFYKNGILEIKLSKLAQKVKGERRLLFKEFTK